MNEFGYEIVPVKSKKPYFIVYINADSNDGDYISRETRYTVKDFNKRGIKAVKIIKKKLSDNHALENMEDILTEEESEFLEDAIEFPYSDWGICHSIEDIEVYYFDENNKKCNVKF